jgi:hypothetical protein
MLYVALFAYEYYDPLRLRFKEKHLWTKNATPIGVTEYVLRLMGWLSVIMIIEIVRQLMLLVLTMTSLSDSHRMKELFEPELAITFANNESVLV